MNALRRLGSPWITPLVVALLIRGLIPAGFMPGEGSLVELCTPSGVHTVLVDPASGEVLDEQGEGAHAACSWALVIASEGLPSIPVSWAVPTEPSDSTSLRADTLSACFTGYLPPVRGPPLV